LYRYCHFYIRVFSNGGSPLRDPASQAVEILAVTRGASLSGTYGEQRTLKNLPASYGVIGEH